MTVEAKQVTALGAQSAPRDGGRWASARLRLGLGGLWGIASVITASFCVYLWVFAAIAAGSDSGGAMALAVTGGLCLVIGVAGVWATVPPHSRVLEVGVDGEDVRPGQSLTGTLTSERPEQAIEVLAICRGMRLVHNPVGSRTPMRVEETEKVLPATVEGAGPRRSFEVAIPAKAPTSRRSQSRPMQWFVVAREGDGRRAPVAVVPFTVHR